MKYVWYEGRCYEKLGTPDKDGKILIADLRDHSRGISTDIKYTRECSEKDAEAIEYFLEMAARGRRDESQKEEV